jgi:hypothetical protein
MARWYQFDTAENCRSARLYESVHVTKLLAVRICLVVAVVAEAIFSPWLATRPVFFGVTLACLIALAVGERRLTSIAGRRSSA